MAPMPEPTRLAPPDGSLGLQIRHASAPRAPARRGPVLGWSQGCGRGGSARKIAVSQARETVLGQFCPLGGKPMANNFSPIGTEVQTHSNASDAETDPDIAAMTDGRFFVAFERDVSGNLEIRGQFVNPDGTLS